MHIMRRKKYIKVFYSEIWTEVIIGRPTFKIVCDTLTSHPPSKMDGITINRNFIKWQKKNGIGLNFSMKCRSRNESQVSNYRLLGASSCFVTCKFFTFNSLLPNHFVVWNIEKPSNYWISKIKHYHLQRTFIQMFLGIFCCTRQKNM